MPRQYYVTEVCKHPVILQLSYGEEQANTYILVSDRHAIVIDACSKSIVHELHARKIVPDYVLLTHEHADHLWGLNYLREKFPGIKVIAQEQCNQSIINPKANKAAHYWIYAVIRFGKDYQNPEAAARKYCCESADIEFIDKYEFQWQGYRFKIIHTPGHSSGCCMISADESMVFSGDTMLNENTFLKFDGGDMKDFLTVTLPIIKSIKGDVKIYPGHGMPFLRKDWNGGLNE